MFKSHPVYEAYRKGAQRLAQTMERPRGGLERLRWAQQPVEETECDVVRSRFAKGAAKLLAKIEKRA